MSSAPGRQLLHYRLLEKLGEGGMGEVWKALDTSLDREVAIKMLPAEVSANPERLARFEREAKLLASLNHPNIATIHGLHQAGGTHFIAMEYVRGEDLSVRLLRGPLPLDETLVVTRQIAEALEAAHEQGVVHRDLKPANVVVDGEQVQVLDFGLAKALSADPASVSGGTLSASPTITSAQTRDGMILGTAAYMSPEQARGRPVDRRADIWAFGCLLYEALTAKTAYAAETISDTLVAVLSGEPDWDALPAGTPAGVRHLIRRCLEKDARRRLRDIGEARVALEDAIAGHDTFGPVSTTGTTAATGSRGLPRAVWPLLAVVTVAAFAAGWLLHRPAPVEGLDAERSIRRLTFSNGLEHEPNLSPDGNYIAYTTDRAGNLDIEIFPLGGGTVNRITTHPKDDAQPRWSPDGTRLAFVSARDREEGLLVNAGGLGANSGFVSSEGGDIFVMPAFGGAATKLIDRASYPAWSPDGRDIVFQSNRDGNWRIWRMPAAGGEPIQLTTGERLRFDYQPVWSPDGRWIAYCSYEPGEDNGGVFVVPAEGGDSIQLIRSAAVSPAWSSDGRALYFASSHTAPEGRLNLWRIPFAPGQDVSSRLQRVTFGTGSDAYPSPSADDRTIAFAHLDISPKVWKLDVARGELTEITDIDGMENSPHLNRDGRRLLFQADRDGIAKQWVRDLETGELQPLLTEGAARLARWSPDGERIAYDGEIENGDRVVAIQRLGETTRLEFESEGRYASTGLQFSPDGSRLVGNDANDLWVHTLEGESEILMANAQFGSYSPDGTQVAFQRNAGSDHRELWVVPASGGEPKMIAGGSVHYSHPQWHPSDPDKILMVIDHLDLGVVSVRTGEMERITELASSTVLVDYPSWSPDGKSIYFSITRRKGDLYLIEQ